MAKVTGCTVLYDSENNSVEINVHGDMLPNSVFMEILDILDENKEKKHVDFIADNPQIMLLIREAFPGGCYRKLELKHHENQMQPYQDAV